MKRFKYIFLMRLPQMATKNVYINPKTTVTKLKYSHSFSLLVAIREIVVTFVFLLLCVVKKVPFNRFCEQKETC